MCKRVPTFLHLRLLVLLALGIALGPGCVTERKNPAVTIHAGVTGKLYPPYFFQGHWKRKGQVLSMLRPPGPAIAVQGGMRGSSAYTIASMRSNSDGSFTFRLLPYKHGSFGTGFVAPIERTYIPPRNKQIVELRSGRKLIWKHLAPINASR